MTVVGYIDYGEFCSILVHLCILVCDTTKSHSDRNDLCRTLVFFRDGPAMILHLPSPFFT